MRCSVRPRRRGTQPVWQQPPLEAQPQPVHVAYAAPPRPASVQRTATAAQPENLAPARERP